MLRKWLILIISGTLKTSGTAMRSYIKIYGPPILEAVKALEKVAIDMPEVCIMDQVIQRDLSPRIARDVGGDTVERFEATVPGFFMQRTGVVVPVQRCHNLISKHGQKLGEYDFFFEWHEEPEASQLNELIGKIDEALKPLGCLYTIITK
ncbi:MAG TPA: hypothetical protein ENN36_07495 [Candidatus Bathyarchaeota archaeon]|nr:hypothetical protein [Candidatus Bathyarchaeota archaeon]